MNDDTRYFIEKLSGIEVDSLLITDYPDNALTDDYATISGERKLTGKMSGNTLMAAFGYALGKATASGEALFLSSSLMPHYVRFEDSMSVSEFLREASSSFDEDMKHPGFSFSSLEKELGLKCGVIFGSVENVSSSINLYLSGEEVFLKYRASLYSEANMRRFLSLYLSVLDGFESCGKLSEIVLQSREDRLLTASFNESVMELGDSPTVVRLFSEQAGRTPGNTAVVYGETRLTYSEVDEISDRIASKLSSMGVGKGDFVPVLIKRSHWFPLTALGVLKCGAAYQPLDPNYPEERLSFMLGDTGAETIIADSDLVSRIPSYSGKILLTEEIEKLEKGELPPSPSPGDTLILLYTSGTTGTPKGAMLTHRNIVSYSKNYMKMVSLDTSSRVAAYASFGFDASMMDIYPALFSGAAIYIVPEEIRADLISLDAFFVKNEISHAFMTTQVGRQFALFTSSKKLKYLSVGGEKLTPLTPPKGLNFINLYGPTECTVAVTAYKVKKESSMIPVGKPLSNLRLYIVDSAMRLLPVGSVGELCISGEQVGKGYYRRPDKTAEVFIPNPFDETEGYETLYRTGDNARWLEDGNIEFIGRRDSQVKIRGFRIELTEVEKVIRDYPGVKDATVAAFDSPSGGKYIAAYVVGDEKIEIEKLNAFIRERKPDYMVPEVTMQIDAVPLTANQKVNRRALPKPGRTMREYKAPGKGREEKIASFVSKLCGTDKTSADEDFFALGLTSVAVIQLTAFLKREFNVPVQIGDLRANPTVEKLAAFINTVSPLKEREKEVFYPVSETQKAIFTECLSDPDSTLYNIPYLFRLSPSLDITRLRKAVEKAFNAHPYLKTILTLNADGEIRAVRRDEARVSISLENVSSLPPREKMVLDFSLTEKELYRITFYHTPGSWYLFLDIHHIIFDGTSFVILLEDIEKAYRGEKIQKEEYTAFEYALDEIEERKSSKYSDAKAYYDSIFSSLDTTDYLPQSDVQGKKEKGYAEYSLTSSLTGKEVEEWCSEYGVSEAALFNTAFGYTLSRYNGTRDAVYATVYNGRSDGRTERSVSMFVKTFPMYFSFSGDESVKDCVMKTGRQYMENMARDIYPFSEIVREYNISPDILFSYQGSQFVFSSIAGEEAEVTSFERDNEKAKMVVLVSRDKDRYIWSFSYNTALYTPSFVESFTRTLDAVLSELLECSTFSSVFPSSRRDLEILEGFNMTKKRYDRNQSVVSLIGKIEKKYPQKTAVVYKSVRLSYSELGRISDNIASHLMKNGIGKGSAVPVLITRSEMMPLAALGVLKSGASYQPLDPSYPGERLSFMIEDSKAQFLIAERKLVSLIPGYSGRILYTDEIMNLEEGPLPPPPSPDDDFILLYTSGTTGKPKGAVLRHRNILNYAHAYIRTTELSRRSRAASYASFGFDANMMDIYPTLMCGATLYIIPEEIRMDFPLIDEFISVNAITHIFMTTQVGREYALTMTAKSLKYLSVGGEKLVPFTPPEGLRFYNIYGPTECTVAVTNYLVKDDSSLLPVGKPLENTKLYVVDEEFHLLPPGGVGELCIAGLQVGKGYLWRPDLTEKSFIPNCFCDEEDYSVLYRTGDIVRWLPDGTIDYVGRRDAQVKVRGFRIELTEIEKVIREYEGIKGAVVCAYDSPAGGKYCAAYIVSDSKVDIPSLNAFIKTKLPPYMVPSVTMQIESIPLTVNQKVDRRSLPKVEFEQSEYSAPESSAEEDFCSVFASVLGLERVGRDDDFFDIGGSSISAMKVVVEAGRKGWKIAYKDVFEYPTPHRLASVLSPEEEKEEKKEEKKPELDIDDEGYDYSRVNALLSSNTLEAFREGERLVIGDVLLLGATGYLGIHLLEELMKDESRTVWAVVREKDGEGARERLEKLLLYYAMDDLVSLIGKRIIIIGKDVTDEHFLDDFSRKGITVFNASASVKHFAHDDEIERVNVKSTQNIIRWSLENDALLIHISTESTAGYSLPRDGRFLFTEHFLYGGQTVSNNQYVKSKFLSERAVYEAVLEKGLKAKVMRVGNLSPRSRDGVFQINYSSNGFMKMLGGYLALDALPYSREDEEYDMSPVDFTARSIVLLSSTPQKCITFMPSNPHILHLEQILKEMRSSIELLEDDEFGKRLDSALSDPSLTDKVSALMTYSPGTGEKDLVENGIATIDNTLTLQILYRLGFQWPVADGKYIHAFTVRLEDEGFFS